MKKILLLALALLAACSLEVRWTEAHATDDGPSPDACPTLQRTLEAVHTCDDRPWVEHIRTRPQAVYSATVELPEGHPYDSAPGELAYGDGVVAVACPFPGAWVEVYATVEADRVASQHEVK